LLSALASEVVMKGALILAVVAALVAGCHNGSGSAAPSDMAASQPIPTTARGEYLVGHLLLCGTCHTPDDASTGKPDLTRFLAGGRPFDTTVGGVKGVVYSANITNDTTSGLGGWTDDQIKRALTHGLDDMNEVLAPIMPYSIFSTLTDSDAQSIVLYLRTLSVDNAVTMNTVPAPMMPAPALDDSKVPQTMLAPGDASYPSSQNGRYLAKLACLSCHTVRGAMGSGMPLNLGLAWAGGVITRDSTGQAVAISSNLTPDATGLAGWSTADLVSTLQTNLEKGTGRTLCSPMPGGTSALGGLNDSDLSDLATFIVSLAPITNGPFGCSDGGTPYGLPDGN
jgi:mono/diheme cytochrome c family protein